MNFRKQSYEMVCRNILITRLVNRKYLWYFKLTLFSNLLWAFCFIICIMGQLMQRPWKFHKKVYGLWRHLFNILQCHHTQYGSENHSTIKYEPRTRLEQWNNVQLKSQRENNYDSKSVLVYALHLRLSWIW